MSDEVQVFIQDTTDKKARMMMLGNTPRLWEQRNGRLNLSAFIQAAGFATQYGVQPTNVCLMRAASNVGDDGFREIKEWRPTEGCEHIKADAVHVREPGAMTMFQSADCASIAVHNRKTQESIFYHHGRPAGMPIDGQTIITDTLDRIAPDNEIHELEVIVAGTICGAHLPHREGLGRKQADAYLDEFGPEVFYDIPTRSLDIKKVIMAVYLGAGLESDQITFFGPDCTFAAPCCASNREDLVREKRRTKANSIIWLTNW